MKLHQSRLELKILSDPYYGPAYKQLKSINKIIEAGFFDDGLNIGKKTITYDPRWMSTPLDKIKQTDSKNSLILLTTGGFSPPHNGHIGILETAKETLQINGYDIIGGYISPSHDDYVQTKQNTTLAERRVKLCQKMVSDSEWLMVDPWESLHNNYSLNFTTVIERLKKYLSFHLNKNINVCYVFGSDNAAFCNAFLKKGIGACVLRPGFQQPFLKYKNNSKNIFFADNIKISYPISSSNIRLGKQAIPKAIIGEYFQKPEPHTKKHFLLRDEGLWAISPWLPGRELNLIKAKEIFLKHILSLLNKIFKNTAKVQILNLNEQITLLKQTLTNQTISLDPCFIGNQNLNVSRYYEISGGLTKSVLGPRPGSSPIEKQLQQISPGYYTLVDDDSVTGQTLSWVKSILPENIKINRTILMNKLIQKGETLDLCDLRDFMLGAKNSGLVVKDPTSNKVFRVPYMSPYVSLHQRASIPADQELSFSTELWKANKEFFASTYPKITLKEADTWQKAFFYKLGFETNTGLEEICDWHLQRLIPQNISKYRPPLSNNFTTSSPRLSSNPI